MGADAAHDFMNVTVQRTNYDALATQGEMLLDGVHFGFTLEPRKDQSQGKPYCVPAGTFQLVLGWSDHFEMVVPKVVNVPGFDAVEIHPGNFPKDTHACCLVGETESADFVGQSRDAFDELMQKLQQAGSDLSITYKETQQ